ncbi:MAG: zinc ABC transporter substrate-binding protein [Actinomycetales bacterium]|nr:zinc ABC transporter substrate-binding protein [Actinomycetales bacterium]
MKRSPRRLLVAAVTLAVPLATVTGCGDGGGSGGTDQVSVVAAFYPLRYASERVGGEHVRVTDLTRPGTEPHDLELDPRDVVTLAEADLVVYLPGFQPAVDDAVAAEVGDSALDVAPAARLDPRPAEGADRATDRATDQETPATSGTTTGHDDGAEHGTEGGHGTADPHFWLDPSRLADVADTIAVRLAALDPAHAADYRAGATGLRAELETLDAEFASALATCTSRDLVTSHEAFGYLAGRYDLRQLGVAGLNPEAEPSAAALAALADVVRERRVRTIYHETLVSPDVATTLARETGTRVAVLDPIEGVTKDSAARDYPGIMRANLATLREGQECS